MTGMPMCAMPGEKTVVVVFFPQFPEPVDQWKSFSDDFFFLSYLINNLC